MTPFERAKINVTVSEAEVLARAFVLQREAGVRAAAVMTNATTAAYIIHRGNWTTMIAWYDASGAILVRRVQYVPASILCTVLNRICDALDIPRVFKTVGKIRLNMDGVQLGYDTPAVLAGPIIAMAARVKLLNTERAEAISASA